MSTGTLSIGHVSALIAAGTAIVQAFLPLAIPLILVAFISKNGNRVTATAVTWSTLNKALHSSWWPMILRSDSVARSGVTASVTFATYLSLFTTILVAIAAVITPLGLYDDILPCERVPRPFSYAKDPSPFGYGTPPRSNPGFSRICGIGSIPCPGSNFTATGEPDSTYVYMPDGYDTGIPLEVREIWSSGLKGIGTSVSSIFDIEWRSYVVKQQDQSGRINMTNGVQFNNGSAFLAGGYRQLHTVLLSDSIEAYEGLIVDTVNGGIGFRNHSIPPASAYGSTWTEDILFVQPETECVDTNLTADYQLRQDTLGTISASLEVMLTDRGGFENLDAGYEWWHLNNTQDEAYLWDRAYKAAWLNNALTMMYMNITNPSLRDGRLQDRLSHVGKTFMLQGSSLNYPSTFDPQLGLIEATQTFGDYLPVPPNSFQLNVSTYRKPLYPNPHNITGDKFEEAGYMCRGFNSTFIANISNFAVTCGLLYPPARPVGRAVDAFDRGKAGENYTQPIYSCASASKALIRTVTFSYNGTGSFSGLRILSAKEKEYSNPSSKPLWGVEDSGLTYEEIAPLWGLLDPSYENKSNVSTLRKESLWLPGYTMDNDPTDTYQNMPGATFHVNAMQNIYSYLGYSISTSSNGDVLDYSGRTQFAMYRKWLELSQNAKDSAKIINLIWTDIVANAVVGTRGRASVEPEHVKRNESSAVQGNTVEITLYQRRVQYRLLYAIPAILLLAMTLGIFLMTALLIALQRTGTGKMKWFLDQTSLGRSFTALLYPEVSSQQTPGRTWMERDARKLVTVAADRPHAGDSTGGGMKEGGLMASNQSKETVLEML